ncbi:YibE/F family protein [Nonomuraea africana]|uniref:YibE/F family protein n=1 Tax=Nonomuraea africana TaxID=46171 RepID=UPI00298F3AF7|nr:YibE/F family protein [Nonomuraea africana]
MGANHSHQPAGPTSRGTLIATVAVIVPLALATLIALIWMWPAERKEPAQTSQPQAGVQRLTGTVTAITLKRCPKEPPLEGAPQGEPVPPDPATCGDAQVELTSGPHTGETIITQLPSGPGAQRFAVGDDIRLIYSPEPVLEVSPYQISDHDRSSPLWLMAAAFVLAVVAFGRWRGLTALVGLAITFVLLLAFVIPAILAGQPPLLVAIIGAAAIMFSVLYLTHGFTITTSMAIFGTVASLTLTGLLSYAAIDLVQLNGITDESSFYLDTSYRINTEGLLLASILIGSLGVLDDVTVTQAVTVAELAHANPGYRFGQLYRAAARVGRAHIASVINTIILAYAGASLPLLLLISVGDQGLGEIVTNPVLAQEIVRSVVGTLGLIAAVPITTALAALAGIRATRGGDDDHAAAAARHRRRPDSLPDLVG